MPTAEQLYGVNGNPGELTFEAATDLSAQSLKAVYLSAAGVVSLATDATDVFGILQNKPAAAENAIVKYAGVSRVIAGAAFTVGDKLMVGDSQGRLITATDNHWIVGRALFTATAINQEGPALIQVISVKGDNT
jgi:hypothetical protein